MLQATIGIPSTGNREPPSLVIVFIHDKIPSHHHIRRFLSPGYKKYVQRQYFVVHLPSSSLQEIPKLLRMIWRYVYHTSTSNCCPYVRTGKREMVYQVPVLLMHTAYISEFLCFYSFRSIFFQSFSYFSGGVFCCCCALVPGTLALILPPLICLRTLILQRLLFFHASLSCDHRICISLEWIRKDAGGTADVVG